MIELRIPKTWIDLTPRLWQSSRMCCFSGQVTSVHNTRIFARATAANRQVIVYQMEYKAKSDLAMVLPIPTLASAGEKAVRFISLEKYPKFFEDMRSGFPLPRPTAASFGGVSNSLDLAVEEVGSFEASFVPTVADFSRLDPRFRLPDGTWEKLPDYRSFGFAVFKLKPDATTIHPMAFEFVTTKPEAVFFPTVHIHDGKVHTDAEFDHEIYLQGKQPEQQTQLLKSDQEKPSLQWQESNGIPVQFMQAGRTEGTVDPKDHIYRLTLNGMFLNRDFYAVPNIA